MQVSGFDTCVEGARISLADDGILRITNPPGTTIGRAEADGILCALEERLCGQRVPLLVEGDEIRGMDIAARKLFAGSRALAIVQAQAIVATSPIGRLIGNFFLGINRPPFPTEIFADEAQALDWLKKQAQA